MKPRSFNLDFTKVVLAFFVISIHTYFLSDINLIAFQTTVNGIFRIAVPLFSIISGYYFYFALKKGTAWLWMKKLVTLYILWMAIYAFEWIQQPSLDVTYTLKFIAKFIIGYHHLWYVSGILTSALLVIVLHKYITNRLLFCILVALYLMGVSIQYIGNYEAFPNTPINIAFNYTQSHRNFLFFSLPFFCFGLLINKLKLYNYLSLTNSALTSTLTLSLIALESTLNYYFLDRLDSFDNLLSLIFCPFIFIFLIKLDRPVTFTPALANFSTALYFSHPLIIGALTSVLTVNSVLLTLIVFVLASITSLVLLYLHSKTRLFL